VLNLLGDISSFTSTNLSLEVILTLNVNEELPFDPENYKFAIKIISNRIPLGFSANHNRAFEQSNGRFFCVINPDIRFDKDPFLAMITGLQDSSIGLAAPLVVDENGAIEDSARHFPTPLKIVCKALGGCKAGDYVVKDKPIFPDWVAGMFMLFRRETFERSGGFDESYFLYYEDVDLCTRLRLQGYEVAVVPNVRVIHHAHRSSHSNVKYLFWHLSSMLRYFLSMPFLKTFWLRWIEKSNHRQIS
jgi:GT2 family glycosyltransferase